MITSDCLQGADGLSGPASFRDSQSGLRAPVWVLEMGLRGLHRLLKITHSVGGCAYPGGNASSSRPLSQTAQQPREVTGCLSVVSWRSSLSCPQCAKPSGRAGRIPGGLE